MERLFNTHLIRKQKCLDGLWDFQTVTGTHLPDKYTDKMAVPSCWETNPKYCCYSGKAVYKKDFTLAENGNLRFLFKGISHTASVYLDGMKIGEHYNAFTPFSIIAANVKGGHHRLEVIADNSFSEKSALHIPNDYFTYGGITRSVFLETVPNCYIDRFEFKPFYRNEIWHADIRVFIRSLSDTSVDTVLSISCGNQKTEIPVNAIPMDETVVSIPLEFDDIKPWSPDQPILYLAVCELVADGKPIDDLIDRIGFRTVTKSDNRILINGKPIFIKGVNRHEDHGSTGCAVPLSLMYADISLIKDLGANAVRTCHYPNDEIFLDMCDENGIMVWEESHARNTHRQKMLTTPLFKEQSMKVMHEMLEYHFNHPSIIIWGCLNEDSSDTEEGKQVYKLHMDYLSSDTSRLCTFASNKHPNDICLDMADICSFNIYPLWYGDTVDGQLDKIYNNMKNTGNFNKPVIISEYGAGGIYGFRDNMHVKWSEEYQSDVLDAVTAKLMNEEKITGIFVWQFCDCRIKGDDYALARPKSRNNKGLVDEFRRPKMAYYTVRKLFSGL